MRILVGSYMIVGTLLQRAGSKTCHFLYPLRNFFSLTDPESVIKLGVATVIIVAVAARQQHRLLAIEMSSALTKLPSIQ